MRIKNQFKAAFLVLIPLFVLSCSGQDLVAPVIDQQQLDEAFVSARSMTGLKSLAVSNNGTIIKEEYFGLGALDQQNDIRSVTKSVTSLLIGIAIDKGYIQSVDQKISDFIAPLVQTFPSDKTELTIWHLLTMSGGFHGNELADPNLYNNWAVSDNRINYILNVPLVYQPGEHFSYDSRSYHLLSVILTQATGMSTKEFAESFLFTPLAISSREWLADRQGYNNGSAGLSLTARDMIKIGELILNEGLYNGNRVVSAEWISQLKQSKISTNFPVSYGGNYSFGWWLGSYDNRNFLMAMGWGGQFIVVVPRYNLVITAVNEWTGLTNETAGIRWQSTAELIMTRIMTAFN